MADITIKMRKKSQPRRRLLLLPQAKKRVRSNKNDVSVVSQMLEVKMKKENDEKNVNDKTPKSRGSGSVAANGVGSSKT